MEKGKGSDQRGPVSPVSPVSPEGNMKLQMFLRHQEILRQTYPSMDMSEMSYNSEFSGFPGSRHSSLNTEPLTLNAGQMHDAKGLAEDVIDKVGSEKAGDIFTKVEEGDLPAGESGSDELAKQLNSLVEKAQEVVEANNLHSQSMGKTSGARTPTTDPRENSDEIIESISAESKAAAAAAPHEPKIVPTELAEDMQPAVAENNTQLTTRSAPEEEVKKETKEE